MKKALAALGLAASLSAPASLEALMLLPCIQTLEVSDRQDPYIRVRHRDTLWEISQREYGTPWAYGALAIINHIPDPNKIRKGDLLLVPPRVTQYFLETLCPAIEKDNPSPRQVARGTEEYCNLFGPKCILDQYGFCYSKGNERCDSIE
ncbi:MAG: hypothetical protein AABX13_03510 [Nanoarchaeota archaeon]